MFGCWYLWFLTVKTDSEEKCRRANQFDKCQSAHSIDLDLSCQQLDWGGGVSGCVPCAAVSMRLPIPWFEASSELLASRLAENNDICIISLNGSSAVGNQFKRGTVTVSQRGEREFLVFQSKLDLEKAVSESLDRLLISLMCMVLFHLRS